MYHIRSLTYAPKIPKVLKRQCFQTIRRRGKKIIWPGDLILFHGWEGIPYRSPWSWRVLVKVRAVKSMWVFEEGIRYNQQYLIPWTKLDKLAQDDGIEPPTGVALKEVLKSLNPQKWEGLYDIIKWLSPLDVQE